MNRILVTGGSGFIGSALLTRLAADGRASSLRCLVRRQEVTLPDGIEPVVGDLSEEWSTKAAVNGVEAVVHAAARVHLMRDRATDPLREYRRVNVEGTLRLARDAAAVGARRFVFISSVKVHGESTPPGRPFRADDVPAPTDAYAVSKYEAERGLTAIAEETGLQVVVLRPVLVYGPGVGANFRSMLNWLHSGIPLPLGALHNRRSLVSVGNLVDLITKCLDHPAAASRAFLVSDGEDLSTTELLNRTAAALGKPARLIPVPSAAVTLAARIAGRSAVADRLCNSLQVDIGNTRRLLQWTPPQSVDEALRRTAEDFLSHRTR